MATTGSLPDQSNQAQLEDLYSEMLDQVVREEVDSEAYLTIGNAVVESSMQSESFTALALTAHTLLNLDQTITRS